MNVTALSFQLLMKSKDYFGLFLSEFLGYVEILRRYLKQNNRFEFNIHLKLFLLSLIRDGNSFEETSVENIQHILFPNALTFYKNSVVAS